MNIMLSPGHSGENESGAISEYGNEKELNKVIAKMIRETINRNSDINVIYIDEINLENKVRVAQILKPDIILEVHCNAFSDNQVRGVELLQSPSDKTSGDITNKLNRKLYTYGIEMRPIKKRDLFLLRNIENTIILEAGFITNKKDAKLLTSKSYQRVISFAVCDTLLELQEEEGVG